MGQTYFQKGLGLRSEVRPQLKENYRSQIVDQMRANGFRLEVADLTFRLAEEFGFCYGVERAVEYAYEAVAKFPDRRIFLTGEIIHNPYVNGELKRRGILFLPEGAGRFDQLDVDDVVLIPAFGVPKQELDVLSEKGCVVVDTTCGSVLNVWKNVELYGRRGITSVIHGKFEHEETRATFSRTSLHPGSHYVVVRDKTEARYVSDYIAAGGDRTDFVSRFEAAMSEGFDPDVHLERIGLANQTTMLSSESLEIAEIFREAFVGKYGVSDLADRFISFDTICSATEDRQGAIQALRSEHIDIMIVIGGYNSSNTTNLARIASSFTQVFHIEDASSIVNASEIRHKRSGLVFAGPPETRTLDWLKPGPQTIGLTAGASTPNNQIGEAVERIVGFRDTINPSPLKDLVYGSQ
jgi:4-hydroxy-3-methylbut-2-enyl diphosphate reductase